MILTEEVQADLSALLDGELDSSELLPLLDRLVENRSCQEFYRQARRLDEAVVTSTVAESATPLPGRIWGTIRRRSGLDSAPRSWRMPAVVPAWAMGAAAVCLVVLAFWNTPPASDPEQSARVRPGLRIELEVGADPDQMSDERFVSLTAELLRADARYHRKMLAVMSEVDRVGFEREGTTEGRRSPEEGFRGEDSFLDSRGMTP